MLVCYILLCKDSASFASNKDFDKEMLLNCLFLHKNECFRYDICNRSTGEREKCRKMSYTIRKTV